MINFTSLMYLQQFYNNQPEIYFRPYETTNFDFLKNLNTDSDTNRLKLLAEASKARHVVLDGSKIIFKFEKDEEDIGINLMTSSDGKIEGIQDIFLHDRRVVLVSPTEIKFANQEVKRGVLFSEAFRDTDRPELISIEKLILKLFELTIV